LQGERGKRTTRKTNKTKYKGSKKRGNQEEEIEEEEFFSCCTPHKHERIDQLQLVVFRSNLVLCRVCVCVCMKVEVKGAFCCLLFWVAEREG